MADEQKEDSNTDVEVKAFEGSVILVFSKELKWFNMSCTSTRKLIDLLTVALDKARKQVQ